MDREAMARQQRRREVLQALEFERDRESSLVAQLEEVAAEEAGPAVDEAAFARMDPEDVALVREVLAGESGDEEADDGFDFGDVFAADEQEADDGSGIEEEIARLEAEIATCRSRQRAYVRYLEALGD